MALPPNSFNELPAPLNALVSAEWDAPYWTPHLIGKASAWWTHVPFAFWLVSVTRPRQFVELGTHNGVSYAAFCEAVARCKLSTRCFAVDTWEGDVHAGYYDAKVYNELRVFHDRHFSSFSELLRTTFDEALPYIHDASVDLLHIDGLHTYEAVRHDFESWLPKLSDRAVVLLHDTNLRERNFGVFKFFGELRTKYPTFEFYHGCGLGIVAVGNRAPELVRRLCAVESVPAAAALRERFSLLGERWLCATREQLNAESLEPRMAAAVKNAEAELSATLESARQTALTRERDLSMQLQQVSDALDRAASLNRILETERVESARMVGEVQLSFLETRGRYEDLVQRYEAAYDDPSHRLLSKLLRRLRWIVARIHVGTTPFSDLVATEIVRRSVYFDRNWYVATYPDVAGSSIDPACHYVRFGGAEGRDPSSLFSTSTYLADNPDVAAAKCNPLAHYLLHGRFEGRKSSASSAALDSGPIHYPT